MIGDMPPVLAQVGRDAVGPRLGRHDRRAHGIGMWAAARIPDGRDMIDIDAETQRLAHGLARLPGFTGGMAASSGGSASA